MCTFLVTPKPYLYMFAKVHLQVANQAEKTHLHLWTQVRSTAVTLSNMFYVIHWSNVRSWFTGTGTNVCYMEEVKNIEKTTNISENQESEEEDKVKVL